MRTSSASGMRPSSMRPADYLRLHPERAALRFRMPERLASCSTPHQVHRLKLLPWFVALPGCNPGETPDVDFRSRPPFIVGRGCQADQGTRHPVRSNPVLRIELAKQLHSPIEQAVRIVDAKLEPVEAVGIPGEGTGRFYVVPALVTVAVPLPGDGSRAIRSGPAATLAAFAWSLRNSSTSYAGFPRRTCPRSIGRSRTARDDCGNAPPGPREKSERAPVHPGCRGTVQESLRSRCSRIRCC